MRWLICFCVALVALTSSGAAQTSHLARLNDRDDLLGWEGVGRLDRDRRGICSAVLIASDLALTAAHCIHDPETGMPVPTESLSFRAGFSNGASIAERDVYLALSHEGYDPTRQLDTENIRHDVALLRLAEPIPVSEADPFALHPGHLTQDRLLVASYGRGRMEALSLESRCHLLDRREGVTFFDCNITFGSSGAPVFALAGDTVRLLSLVSGMATMNGRKLGLGMVLPEIVADLRKEMGRLPAPPVRSRVRRIGSRAAAAPDGSKFVRVTPRN